MKRCRQCVKLVNAAGAMREMNRENVGCLGGRTETSMSDVVRSHIGEAVDDPHPSYPPSWSSDPAQCQGQLTAGRQRDVNNSASPGLLHPAPSPSTLIPSPKRRRLEAMDAHQSQMDCESRPPNDQHKAAVPTIRLNEEPNSPPTASVNFGAPTEGTPNPGERSDMTLSTASSAENVADPHSNCRSVNDENTLPVSTENSS